VVLKPGRYAMRFVLLKSLCSGKIFHQLASFSCACLLFVIAVCHCRDRRDQLNSFSYCSPLPLFRLVIFLTCLLCAYMHDHCTSSALRHFSRLILLALYCPPLPSSFQSATSLSHYPSTFEGITSTLITNSTTLNASAPQGSAK